MGYAAFLGKLLVVQDVQRCLPGVGMIEAGTLEVDSPFF